ncbi:hypothetical protein ESCO_000380 [Escovopsis weberi]|uniref:Uncharacterized protein n=1 Tax=Escovopsis weberi TaxID=150374 RepID=A0A0M9VTC3_ESCWE|nr:hypothetical protein ESCO_000380 [Escovopsis weberi]
MRFPFRKKSKKSQQDISAHVERELREAAAGAAVTRAPLLPASARSSRLLAALPGAVLERIFAFVCPHAADESYETHESSVSDSGCMLCDTRDLAHCALVSRSWHESAIAVLYHSVRIDQVHYCSLEAVLAERRKHTHRFDKNGIPEDPAQARLRLFRRTVRDDPTRIGKKVLFLKIPYMLREYCHVELAQTIAVLPNLKYIDLPQGMFADEPSYATLRLEVQARCPNFRKMAYHAGSEGSFVLLAAGRAWRHLEVLELTGVDVDANSMRAVLGALASLRALKVTQTESLSDEVLSSAYGLPLPALEEIVLEDTPRVTAAGLIEYLAWQETQQALRVLSLTNTGVQPKHLPEILTMAPRLRTLAIQCKVVEPLPGDASIAMLAAPRMELLRFEIAGQSDIGAYESIKATYYSHLASSIIAGGFPRMSRLYVLDDSFPEKLSALPLPPPNAAFAAGGPGHGRSSSTQSLGLPEIKLLAAPSPRQFRASAMAPASHRFSSNNPFAAAAALAADERTAHKVPELEIYTKSNLAGKWSFSRVDAFAAGAGRGGHARRPSSYGLAADVAGTGWDRGEARRSVMIPDSTGMFLPVPGAQDGACSPRSGPLTPASPGRSPAWS